MDRPGKDHSLDKTTIIMNKNQSQKHASSNSREFTLAYTFAWKVLAHTMGKPGVGETPGKTNITRTKNQNHTERTM